MTLLKHFGYMYTSIRERERERESNFFFQRINTPPATKYMYTENNHLTP